MEALSTDTRQIGHAVSFEGQDFQAVLEQGPALIQALK